MPLYQVTASNQDGIDGVVHLSNGKKVATNHPLNDLPGFNPEELLALAWSTCLNATIQALLERQYQEKHKSKVDVRVELRAEAEVDKGYYFAVTALTSIEGLPLTQAEKLVQSAHERCPVSKLLAGSRTIDLQVLPYQA